MFCGFARPFTGAGVSRPTSPYGQHNSVAFVNISNIPVPLLFLSNTIVSIVWQIQLVFKMLTDRFLRQEYVDRLPVLACPVLIAERIEQRLRWGAGAGRNESPNSGLSERA